MTQLDSRVSALWAKHGKPTTFSAYDLSPSGMEGYASIAFWQDEGSVVSTTSTTSNTSGYTHSGYWESLIEPYGWLESTQAISYWSLGSEYLLTLALKVSDTCNPVEDNEWLVRADLLKQAACAVETIRKAGWDLQGPPQILIGGDYVTSFSDGTVFRPGGSLSMTVKAREFG